MEKPARAKSPRQSWKATQERLGKLPKMRALLSNYLTGRQYDAGVEICSYLSLSFVEGYDWRSYGEISRYMREKGFYAGTYREAMKKLLREGIITKREAIAYKRHRRRRKHKERKQRRYDNMVGQYYISFGEYANIHRRFAKLGGELYQGLIKAREER